MPFRLALHHGRPNISSHAGADEPGSSSGLGGIDDDARVVPPLVYPHPLPSGSRHAAWPEAAAALLHAAFRAARLLNASGAAYKLGPRAEVAVGSKKPRARLGSRIEPAGATSLSPDRAAVVEGARHEVIDSTYVFEARHAHAERWRGECR